MALFPQRPCRDYVPTLSGTPKKRAFASKLSACCAQAGEDTIAALKLGFAPPTKWPYSLTVRAGITSPHFPAPQKTLTREQAICLLRSSRGRHYCCTQAGFRAPNHMALFPQRPCRDYVPTLSGPPKNAHSRASCLPAALKPGKTLLLHS